VSQVQCEPAQSGGPDPSCSFCRKSYIVLGPLVEGPDNGKGRAYICHGCAELVISLFESERRRREGEAERLGPEEMTREDSTDGGA
jgi:hypothetical protein